MAKTTIEKAQNNYRGRIRVSVETQQLVRDFCDKYGTTPDVALVDLICSYEQVRSGGYGSSMTAMLTDLAALESVNATLAKTNLLLVAEMRNLQAAQYVAMGYKIAP